MPAQGWLVLEGGAEFGGGMAKPDRRAIELAGGMQAPIRIIPAAAAPDNNHQRAGQNGVRWFESLGASDVSSIPLIDRQSAMDTDLATELRAARLIYLLGGFPGYLGRTLADSAAWLAVLDAWDSGAVIAGSSAGAMVLCERYFDPYEDNLLPGLNLLPDTVLVPHYNRSGASWLSRLRASLPEIIVLGIDEQTGAIGRPGGEFTVMGQGAITLIRPQAITIFRAGQTFSV